MVIDLTGDSTSEEEPQNCRKAIGTSLQKSELLLASFRQARVIQIPNGTDVHCNELLLQRKTQEKLQNLNITAVPIRSSSSSSEPRSHGSENSRKRRRNDEISSTSSLPEHHGLSKHFMVDDMQKRTSGLYVKVKDSKPGLTKIRRGSRKFQPPHSSNQTFFSLQSLYAEKLASIDGPPVNFTCRDEIRKVDFNFEFISNYKLQEGVEQIDPNFHAGCDCSEERCNLNKCTCPSQEEGSHQRIVPYTFGKDGVVVLREDFMKRKSMIYECSLLCGCGPSCMNRVVERGRTVSLQIFETRNRGFGLRSRDRIQAGQYVDCYLGEVVTKVEADDREEAVSNNSASYLFSLDFLVDDDEIYVVDGRKFGSITRFMNHSCKPNCRMFPVSHNHADQRLFSMAFFALTDISPGTELTFDYYPNWKSDGKDVDPEAVKCLCGEKNCRGQLWPNQRKTLQQD
ncbi:histone-lysine N-methyltransferase [Emydomyces testavorans]|uniref:Histone-lysine N-methyltransferase n=1 Tax=Emydomyces testavorans TaxID=2070801 RepID=A0AAF0DDD3_9EURO|nr:histone-lysine N-methyltransferase [Emydomyces testavorans]